MLGDSKLFISCLQCFKLLEKATNIIFPPAVVAFLLIDIAGLAEYNHLELPVLFP